MVIEPRYAHLVNRESRFWNVSGLRATASLSGIEVEADSLLSLVRGGIAFGSPARARENAAPARSGERFPLYSSREAALEEECRYRYRYRMPRASRRARRCATGVSRWARSPACAWSGT
ncbi:hypothetical protein [Microbulbifer taiwanensis]|uniref:hypothetical protein n=1 Tax=Microbulbifer taiwanensis TaxID=986746 RepID=UPI00361A4917